MTWKRFLHYRPFVRGIHLWGWFPSHRGRNVDLWCFFFVVSLNKLLKQQSSCRWFEAPCGLCDVIIMKCPFLIRMMVSEYILGFFLYRISHKINPLFYFGVVITTVLRLMRLITHIDEGSQCQFTKNASCHDANFVVTGGTGGCRYDNLQWSPWR